MKIVPVRGAREPVESNIRAIIRRWIRSWAQTRRPRRDIPRYGGVLAAMMLVMLPACDRPEPKVPNPDAHPGATAVEPGSPELTGANRRSQTIYAPAYSAVATSNNAQQFQLAITLSVRNTDRTLPIVITAIAYHHQDGRLVREFLKTPLRLAPLAALDFFVRESDTSGGSVSSFLVDWVGEPAASAPLVETVMVGTGSNQGISFTCPGRVVSDPRPSRIDPLPLP
jgi:hypothetical protein